jgi:hypothetical protein
VPNSVWFSSKTKIGPKTAGSTDKTTRTGLVQLVLSFEIFFFAKKILQKFLFLYV